MKSIKLKFSGDTVDNLAYQPNKFQDSFYQICQFKEKEPINLYMTRKVIFDEKYTILKIFEKKYDSRTLNKFLKNTNINKYKIYPTNDISYIELPNGSDLMNSRSDLSNNKSAPKWNNTECYDLYNNLVYGGMPNSNNMASPGADISNQIRKVGSADPKFYNGAPDKKNLMMINNNLV
jgi:hypothetical protein